MTTAEQFREQALEPDVDVIVGFAEARTSLAVDLANGALESRQRIVEIFELRIEVFLTL